MADTAIPRIIHRIWLGPNPMSDQYAEYGETWRRHHPDWEMRLWTDETVAELDLPEAYERSRDHLERCDVLRVELLRRFGGVYVDCDVECRKPIDRLIEGVSAFASYQQANRDVIQNGVMGSVPGHPAMERAAREVVETVGSGPITEATGPDFLTPIFASCPDLVVFDHEKFNPYSPVEPWRRDEEFPDAYAIHHWAGHWKSRDYYKDRVARLQTRLHDTRSKLKRTRERRNELAERLEAAERRLSAIESSRWWRARARAAKLLRPATWPLRRATRRR